MNTRQTPEYIFKENSFCVYYKLFGSGAATHLVAILCGTTDGEDVAGDYSILVDGEDIRHSSENICSLYRDQIASFFGSNHHILGVDVTDMFDVHNGQVITNRSQLTFEVQHEGSVIGTFQGAAFQNSEGYPLPEMHNIFRVARQISKQAFLFGGASWYLKLLQVALKTGAPIDKDKDVLDWGCGCGRIARHFFAADHKRITGIDIDPVNIEWANSHLGEKI